MSDPSVESRRAPTPKRDDGGKKVGQAFPPYVWSCQAESLTSVWIFLAGVISIMARFEVDSMGDAQMIVEANPQNRWLSEAEFAGERYQDGEPVSPTMRGLLSATGFLRSSVF